MAQSTTTLPFEVELFSRLAREELARGAVWMAEMAALLAHQADANDPEVKRLLERARLARREQTGEG
ncbi:MAG: hypothetical protein MUC96_29425 [Myxococcaceae bacterium]|jgi:hypothetical protein|nr:hypothetical protein [Myxococcaceae bacterium]